MKIYCRVRTEEQLAECSRIADVILCPEKLKDRVKGEAYTDLPYVTRENSGFIMPEGNVVVKNLDQLGMLKGHKGKVLADSFLYAYNREALRFYREIVPEMDFIAPDELNDTEIKKLGTDFIYKIYGRQRVMFTAQNLGGNYGISGKSELASVKNDRLVAIWEDGYTTLITSEPVSMTDKVDEAGFDRVLLDFTIETAGEVAAVIEAVKTGAPVKNAVRGHHYKSID